MFYKWEGGIEARAKLKAELKVEAVETSLKYIAEHLEYITYDQYGTWDNCTTQKLEDFYTDDNRKIT